MIGLGPRSTALATLAAARPEAPLDVLVVGGGVTGAGVALDAATRGLKVGLVERADFAAGTSSKSSKLVHGGLRYLEQLEFGLVREAATERELLTRLAPHLVEPIPFVIPVTDRLRRAKYGAGLWAYDALASFRSRRIHRHLDAAEIEELVPALPSVEVHGGFAYHDCKTDDVRMVMEVLIGAVRRDATVCNYAAVVDLDGGRDLCVARIEDRVDGASFDVAARSVIVAAGVWTDSIEAMAKPAAPSRVRPSRGIHLFFSRRDLPVGRAATLIPDTGGHRMLIVIPWLDGVLVGTTDTEYRGDIDRPAVADADRDYLLDALNASFDLDLGPRHIAGAQAGLRPLIDGQRGSSVDLSRRHTIYDIADGVVGITGGKLTTWRRMAEDAVDRAAADLACPERSGTRSVRLGCSDVAALRNNVGGRAEHLGLTAETVDHLVRTYGERALSVLDIAREMDLRDPVVDGHPQIAAEAAYCVGGEMAIHLSDFLARRTRLALTDPAAGVGPGSRAPDLVATARGWTQKESRAEVAAHVADVEWERGAALADGS